MDRLSLALGSVLRSLLRRVDYTATYRARVIAARGAYVDVRCDEARVGDLVDVPLKLGIPGVAFTFDALGAVLIAFEAADPRRPYATLFDGGSFGTLTLMGEDGAAKSLARVGDVALAAWPNGMVLQATLTPPSGSPYPIAGAISINEPLVGVVAAGSGSVKG